MKASHRLFIGSLLFLGSIAVAATESPVVATINGRAIRLNEFNQRFDDASKLVNPPANRKVFLEDLVRYEVGVQEAEKRKIENDPVVKERIRQQLYVGLIEKELGDKINNLPVSEAEMESYYKNSPELKSSHILIEVKPNATEAERGAGKKRAEEILKEVRASKKSFEELANLYTDDIVTKKRGGDVGYQNRLTVVAPYFDALMKLKTGEISGLIDTKFGFHIAKLTGRHTYEEADKAVLKNAVFEKKRLAMFNDYFDKLKKKYKITLNPEIVK